MEQNEYNQMIRDLKECVSGGDVEAMKWLGDLYYQGTSGNDENTFAALPYWKMAADYGDNDIAFKVGLCLMSGNGCMADETQGFQYLRQSADAGNSEAQYRVGLCYLDGCGTGENHTAGVVSLRAAACGNHPKAQLDLARIRMQEGDGFQEAMHWICCAHLNGVEEATNTLNIAMENHGNASAIRARIEYIKQHGVIPPKDSTEPTSNGQKVKKY